jgi:O-antigen ligase/Tfp pilus assembly protein PilF
VLLCHLLLSPIVFSRVSAETFEYPKVALLLAVAIILGVRALAGHIAVAAEKPDGRPSGLVQRIRRSMPDGVVTGMLLFMGSAVVSTFASISVRTSIFGSHESFAGLLTILSYGVIFFATRKLFPRAEDVRRLLLAPVIAGSFVSVYAVVQAVHLDPIPWTRLSYFDASTGSATPVVRPFSTLGHPNFMAGYLAMTLPLLACFAARAARRRLYTATAVLGVMALLSVVAIAASRSRGAWFALLVALLVGAVGLSRFGERRGAVLVLSLPALVALGFAALRLVAPGHPMLESIAERLRRTAEIGPRRHIWTAAWRIFEEHPLFGCGLDVFRLAFPRHRTVEYWMSDWNVTPTKAHNEGLHVLATQGVLGGVAALVMAVGLLVAARRALRRAKEADRLLVLAVAAGVAAFYAQNLFGFAVAATGTLFVTFAAVLSRLASPAEPALASVDRTGRLALQFAVAGLLATAVLAVHLGGAALSGGLRFVVGLSAALVSLPFVTGAVLVLEASEPASPARGQAAQSAAAAARSPAPGRYARPATYVATAALIVLVVVRPAVASWFCRQGMDRMARDPDRAAAALTRATRLDPWNDLYRVRLGEAHHRAAGLLGDPTQRQRALLMARDDFQHALGLVPADPYHRIYLCGLLGDLARERLASVAEAFATCDAALQGDPHNAYFYQAAAEAATRLGDLDHATDYARRGLSLYPRFAQLRYQLGSILLTQRKMPDALRELESAIDDDWRGDESGRAVATSTFARALLSAGRVEEAERWARSAVLEAPGHVEIRLTWARALLLLGKREQAIQEYRTILRRQPDHARARQALQALGSL